MSITLYHATIRLYLSIHLTIVDSIVVTTLHAIIKNSMDDMKAQGKFSSMRLDLDVRKNHEHWSTRR